MRAWNGWEEDEVETATQEPKANEPEDNVPEDNVLTSLSWVEDSEEPIKLVTNDTLRLDGTPKGPVFDPEGDGYDYETAIKAGMGPNKDGHWSSRDATTGQLLKGRGHKTWDKLEAGEKEAGYIISKGDDGKYYSTKEGDKYIKPVNNSWVEDKVKVEEPEGKYNLKGALDTGIGVMKRLPSGIAASTMKAFQGMEGASVVDQDWFDKYIAGVEKSNREFSQETREKYGADKFLPGIKITDIAETGESAGFSGASLLASLGAATVVSPIPIPGIQAIAAAGAGGISAYNMDAYTIMMAYLDTAQDMLGRDLTRKEEVELKEDFAKKANTHALWEAVTEGAGNALTLGVGKVIAKPLTEMVGKSVAGKMLKKIGAVGALYAGELAQEVPTEIGQNQAVEGTIIGDKKGEGLDWTPEDAWKTAKNIAPQIFLLSTAMGGSAAVASYGGRKIAERLKKEDTNIPSDSTVPADDEKLETYKEVPAGEGGVLEDELTEEDFLDLQEAGVEVPQQEEKEDIPWQEVEQEEEQEVVEEVAPEPEEVTTEQKEETKSEPIVEGIKKTKLEQMSEEESKKLEPEVDYGFIGKATSTKGNLQPFKYEAFAQKKLEKVAIEQGISEKEFGVKKVEGGWAVQRLKPAERSKFDQLTEEVKSKKVKPEQYQVKEKEETGKIIAEEINKEFPGNKLKYDGIQEGFDDIPDTYQFTTYDRDAKGGTFLSPSLEKKDVLIELDKMVKNISPKKKSKTENYQAGGKNTFTDITLKDIKQIFKGQDVFKNQDNTVTVRLKSGEKILLKKVNIITPDKIAYKIGYGQEAEDGTTVKAMYQDGTITLSMLADKWSIAHESVHFLEDANILSKEDIDILTESFNKENPNSEIADTEKRAKFIAKALADREKYRETPFGKVLQKIQDFIDSLVNLAMRTERGILRDFESGKIFERKFGDKTFKTFKPTYEVAADRWYSQMMNFLFGGKQSKLPGKATPEQMKKAIDNFIKKGDFKEEELYWSGLIPWLDEQSGKVTSKEVQTFLKENKFELEEVVLGEDKDLTHDEVFWAKRTFNNGTNYWKASLFPSYGNILEKDNKTFSYVYPDRPTASRNFDNLQDAKDYVLDLINKDFDYEKTTTAEYGIPMFTMPGGDNYKEFLLKLPIGRNIDNTELTELRDRLEVLKNEFNKAHKADNLNKKDSIKENMLEVRRRIAEIEKESTFLDMHFSGIKNIVVWIRASERMVDGKKVLHIEEIQSAWHQKARKLRKIEVEDRAYDFGKRENSTQEESDIATAKAEKAVPKDFGYGKSKSVITVKSVEKYTGEEAEYDEDAYKATFSDGTSHIFLGIDKVASTFEAKREAERKTREIQKGVPDAPFKDQNKWAMLAMKRMVRHAAENGFDAIAWTTGEQQVQRYKEALQDKVDRIEWEKTKDGIHIKGFKDKDTVVDTRYKENILSNALGDKMSEQIIKDKNQSGIIEGDNLTINDTGMAGFYDIMLPNALKKFFGKSSWGKPKFGTVTINTGGKKIFHEGFTLKMTLLEHIKDDSMLVTKEAKNVDHTFEVEKHLRPGLVLAQQPNGNWNLFENGDTGEHALHSMEIPQKMRDKAINEGMPQFQEDDKYKKLEVPNLSIDNIAVEKGSKVLSIKGKLSDKAQARKNELIAKGEAMARAWKKWKYQSGDLARFKEDGEIWRIDGVFWDTNTNKPLYYMSTLNGEEQAGFDARRVHKEFTKVEKKFRVIKNENLQQYEVMTKEERQTAAMNKIIGQLNKSKTKASTKLVRDIRKSISRTGKLADKAFGALSTRAGNIDPSVQNVLIEYELDYNTKVESLIKEMLPFIKATKKMSKDDYRIFDFARKNADTDVIEAMLDKYEKKGVPELKEGYDKFRALDNVLIEQARNAGFKVNYLKEHNPREIADFEGLMDYLHKKGKFSTVELLIKAREKKNGGEPLTRNEKIELINSLFRGYADQRITLSKPGQLKIRKLRKLTPEMAEFFGDSNSAMLRYIADVTSAIEARKVFGKGVNPDSDIYNLENTIGGYIKRLYDEKKLSPSQELELKSILHARFNPVGTKGIITTFKNLAVIDVMGSPASALRQVGDIAWSFIENGIIPTLKVMPKAIVGASQFTKEHLGISKIGAEFTDKSTSAKAVDKVFRAIWLTKIDAVGKEILINSSYAKAVKRAKSTNPKVVEKLRKELEVIFTNRTDQLIADLKSGAETRDVKLFLLRKLSEYQPATLSELPQGFIEGGNWRALYMLKSFDLKKFDVYRRKVFQKLTSKGTRLEGLREIVRIAFFLTLMEATGDMLIDLFLGREVNFPRSFKSRLSQIALSRYTTMRIQREGLGKAMLEQAIPPTQSIDSLWKDVATAGDGKGLELTKSVPLFGKSYYYWVGKGSVTTEKRERKERKERNKNALKDRYKVRKVKARKVSKNAVRRYKADRN